MKGNYLLRTFNINFMSGRSKNSSIMQTTKVIIKKTIPANINQLIRDEGIYSIVLLMKYVDTNIEPPISIFLKKGFSDFW